MTVNEMQSFLDNELEIKVGDVVKAQVLTFQDNKQVIVSILGTGFEGVIPAKELASTHFERMSDVVSVGDELELVVVSTIQDKENGGSYLLSKRRLDLQKVWADFEAQIKENTVVEAEVTGVVKGGLVATVSGLRAFVPASLVDVRFSKDLQKHVHQTYQFKVETFDSANKKIVLNRRDLLVEAETKQFNEVFQSLKLEDVLVGKVSHFSNFGAFVTLGNGVEGLVHISEIAHNHVRKAEEVLEIGQEVTVKVIALDADTKRIGLSIKQLVPTAWEVALSTFKQGDTVQGVVKRLTDFGAFVELVPGVDGLLHISEVAHERIEKVSDVLSVNETIDVKVIGLDTENKKVSLSRKALIEKVEVVKELPEEVSEIVEEDHYDVNAENVTVTLGDILGDINLEQE